MALNCNCKALFVTKQKDLKQMCQKVKIQQIEVMNTWVFVMLIPIYFLFAISLFKKSEVFHSSTIAENLKHLKYSPTGK